MKAKAKKILPRTQPPKKAKPKIRASRTSERRPPSTIAWASKALCIFVSGLSQWRSFQTGSSTNSGRCYYTDATVNQIQKQSSTNTIGYIQQVFQCGTSNSFTTIVYQRDKAGDPAYPKDNKLRTYFKYHTKIILKIKSFGAGQIEEVQVFKSDETPSLILTTKIVMDNHERLIFLQVTPTKATLAVRSTTKFSYSENSNAEYTFSNSNFSIALTLSYLVK